MSGILGCWHLDGRPVIDVDVERCLAQLLPPGPASTEYWIDSQVALGRKAGPCAGAGASARRSVGARGAVGLFEGRLDNRAELSRSLKDHPRASPDCANDDLVAAAYEQFGDSFVEHFDGDFALAVFDRRQRRLLLARDRLGLRPLCYARTSERFLFASDAKALVAYPGMRAVPDDTALADFVLYFLPADSQTHTCFQGIHALPPGHLLITDAHGVTLRRYFEFDTTRQTRLRGFRAYAAALDDVFVASVKKRLRSERPVAVAVSGGLDSSYIFCTAQRLVRREPGLCPAVLGFHYAGPPGTPSDESCFVDEIERACGTSVERFPAVPGFVDCAADEVFSSESPRVDRLARQGAEMRHRVHDAGARRLLTGHWGDQVLSDSDYLLDLLRTGRWGTLRRHAARWRVSPQRLAARFARDLAVRHAPARVLSAIRLANRGDGAWRSPWFTPRFRELLRERFLAARLPARAGSHHARAIYRQSRLPYHVHCMEWNVRVGAGSGLDVAFPYLDRDLVQFLMSIPGEMQSHDGVQRGLMREAMRGTVPEAIVERRGKGEFTHLGKQSLEGDYAAICDLLGPTALSVQLGYVDGPVLWRLLEEWRTAMRSSDSNVIASRVTDLTGLELLLRGFFPAQVTDAAVQPVLVC